MDLEGFTKLYEEKKGALLTEEDKDFLNHLTMKEMIQIWDMIKEEKDWETEILTIKEQQSDQRQHAEWVAKKAAEEDLPLVETEEKEPANRLSAAGDAQDQAVDSTDSENHVQQSVNTGTSPDPDLPLVETEEKEPADHISAGGDAQDQAVGSTDSENHVQQMPSPDDDANLKCLLDEEDCSTGQSLREQRREERYHELKEQEKRIQEEVERRVQEEVARRLEEEVARRIQVSIQTGGVAPSMEAEIALHNAVESEIRHQVTNRSTVIAECQNEIEKEQATEAELPSGPLTAVPPIDEEAETKDPPPSEKKRRLPLHETPNAKRKRASPTMAESVLKYHKRTPPRFRSTPRTQSVGPARPSSSAIMTRAASVATLKSSSRVTADKQIAPSTGASQVSGAKAPAQCKGTVPKPFALSSDRRASQRLSVMAPPPAQAQSSTQPRRQTPSIVSRPSQSASIVHKPTVPKPFRLSIGNRAPRSSSISPNGASDVQVPFKATPLNKKMFNTVGETGVPRVVKRESTVPQDFSFIKRELERQKAKSNKVPDAMSDKENVSTLNNGAVERSAALKRPRPSMLAKAMLPPPPKRPRTRSSSASKPPC